MGSVLVTGATGLIGSNVCAELLARGWHVRALVRPGAEGGALAALGAELHRGDVTSFAAVRSAAEGCTHCVHTAALVTGGGVHSWSDYHEVNVAGSCNVFDAAREAGLRRVVSFASSPNPRTNDYPPGAFAGDPYFTAKLEIAREVVRRSATGQDVLEISPGATFGPAPTGRRAVLPPGFNSRIALALRGELTEMPAFPLSFGLAGDVATSTVNALELGASGARYDLGGPLDELVDTVTFLNIACERAGVASRVRAMPAERLVDPEVGAQFGPSIIGTALRFAESPRREAPPPSAERELARDVLHHAPTPAREAVEATVGWMLEKSLVWT